MDLSKLSDQDLNSLQSGNMAGLSDAGLSILHTGSQPKAVEQEAPATLRQKVQSSLPMRMVQGMRDPIDGGAQLLPRGLEQLTSGFGMAPNSVSNFFGAEAKKVDQRIAENEQSYDGSRKATGSNGIDIARFSGNVLSPANAAIAARLPMLASTLGRIAGGTVTGGIGGSLQPVDTQTDDGSSFAGEKALQTGLGAVGGAIVTPIAGKLGELVGKFANRLRDNPMDKVTQYASDFANDLGVDFSKLASAEKNQLITQVTTALKNNPNLDPKSLLRQNDFQALGMQGTLGQITRDPRQFATERNLRTLPGTGDPLLERFAGQGRNMQIRMSSFSENSQESPEAGAGMLKALKAYDEKLRTGVSGAYTAARNSAGKDAELPMQGLSQDYAHVLDSFGDKVPSGVRNQFKKYGIEPGGDMTQRKLFTVEEADKLLKVINANQSNDPAVNSALGQLRVSVKNSVTADGRVEDVFTPARKLASERFKLQEAIPALDAASTGATNADDFVNKFIIGSSAKTDQVQRLAEILKTHSPDSFMQARSQIGSYLQRQAYGENLAGDKPFKAEAYAKALRAIGSSKLGAFYSPDELSQLQRIGRVGAYIESVPNAAPVNNSNNWGAITNLASRIPGIPAVVGIANAARTAVNNQTAVGNALAAKAPSNAKLTPDQVAMIARLLSAGGGAAGGAAAQQLK